MPWGCPCTELPCHIPCPAPPYDCPLTPLPPAPPPSPHTHTQPLPATVFAKPAASDTAGHAAVADSSNLWRACRAVLRGGFHEASLEQRYRAQRARELAQRDTYAMRFYLLVAAGIAHKALYAPVSNGLKAVSLVPALGRVPAPALALKLRLHGAGSAGALARELLILLCDSIAGITLMLAYSQGLKLLCEVDNRCGASLTG